MYCIYIISHNVTIDVRAKGWGGAASPPLSRAKTLFFG